MTLPAWPDGLRDTPNRGSFKRLEHHRPVVVTDPEDGPSLMRVQSQTAIERYAVQYIFTAAAYDTFKTFAETTLSQATSHFTMQVPVGGSGFESRRVYIENGQWDDAPYGIQWIVTFTLGVFPTA